MLKINIASDADKLLTTVGKLRAEKLPRALRNAANELGRIVHGGFKGQGGMVGEMKRRFDRPTDFTLKSLRFKLATDANPVVNIWLADQIKKGKSAAEYLEPQMRGGARSRKRHEQMLIDAGIMPADMFAVPANSAPLDGHGNMPVRIINRILYDLKAYRELSKSMLRKRTGFRKNNYFFAGGKKYSMHLRPGVYWHLNGMIVPVLIFTRSPQYSIRYPFYDIGREIYDRYKDKVIARHLKAALSSNS